MRLLKESILFQLSTRDVIEKGEEVKKGGWGGIIAILESRCCVTHGFVCDISHFLNVVDRRAEVKQKNNRCIHPHCAIRKRE